MKILLDECMPSPIRQMLTGHDVFTVAYMGWKGISNGQLLSLAAIQGFEALLTVDQKVIDEFSGHSPPISVIILRAKSNAREDLEPLVPQILKQLVGLPLGAVVLID
jgi:predicted nuclease of predicted toxin-antitoxin system